MVPNVHRPPRFFHFLFHFKMEIFYGPVFCIFVGSQIRPILPCTFHSGPHTTTTTNHKTISAPPRNLGGRPPSATHGRSHPLREGRAAWRRERESRARAACARSARDHSRLYISRRSGPISGRSSQDENPKSVMVPNVHRPPRFFHFLFHFKMEIFYGPVFCIFVGSQIRPILPCTFHSGPHTTTTTNHKTISAPPRNLGGRPPSATHGRSHPFATCSGRRAGRARRPALAVRRDRRCRASRPR